MQRINPLEDSNWNALLAAQPKRSFFHTAEWAKVLADTYGYTPVYFRAGDPKGRKSERDSGSVAKRESRANLLWAAVPDAQKARPAAAAIQVFPEHSPAYFVAEHGNGGFGKA